MLLEFVLDKMRAHYLTVFNVRTCQITGNFLTLAVGCGEKTRLIFTYRKTDWDSALSTNVLHQIVSFMLQFKYSKTL